MTNKEGKENSKVDSPLEDDVYAVFMSPDVQELILSIREKLGIPKDGFFVRDSPKGLSKKEEENAYKDLFGYEKWVVDNNNFASDLVKNVVEIDIKPIIKKYKLPPHSYQRFLEYVCAGPAKVSSMGIDNESSVEVDLFPFRDSSDIEREWLNSDIPFVRLYIPAGMTETEVCNNIKEKWGHFERFWELQGWNKSGKSKIRHNIKNKDIKYRIEQLKKKDLEDIKVFDEKRKDRAIVHRLKQEFPNDRNIKNSKQLNMQVKRFREQVRSRLEKGNKTEK